MRAQWFSKCLFVVAVAIIATPAVSFAQAATDTSTEPMIQHGLQLRRSGDDNGALEEFRRAYAIDHAARSLAQVGLAEQALGLWPRAEADLRHALESQNDPWITARRGTLETSLQNIARHLGSLEIIVNTPSAEVWMGGERIASLPSSQPIRLPGGRLVIEIRAPGFRSEERSVDVETGVLARENVSLSPSRAGDRTSNASVGPMESSHASTTTTVASASSSHTPVPFVVMAVGAAGLIAGAVFYFLRQDAIGNCSAQSDAIHCPTSSDAMRAQMAPTWNAAADATLLAGGIVFVAGLAWFAIDRAIGGNHESRHASIRLSPTEGGLWLGVGGSL